MSHRSTTYPCFLPDLGEFSGSWSHKTYPAAKVVNISRSIARSKSQAPSSKFQTKIKIQKTKKQTVWVLGFEFLNLF